MEIRLNRHQNKVKSHGQGSIEEGIISPTNLINYSLRGLINNHFV